jgi:hypothetical protein
MNEKCSRVKYPEKELNRNLGNEELIKSNLKI